MKLGMIGLGKMGYNLVLNLLGHGHEIVVSDINPEKGIQLAQHGAIPASTIEALVSKLERPRTVWVMVPAGPVVEGVIDTLAGLLDEAPAPLPDDGSPPAPVPPDFAERLSKPRVALLMTEDDLCLEGLHVGAEVAAAALLTPDRAGRGSAALRFSDGAYVDALGRASRLAGAAVEMLPAERLADWAAGAGVTEIVTAYAPVGPAADALSLAQPALRSAGVRLVRLVRSYDQRAWPHATRGFFQFKERIPALLAAMAAER